MRTCLTSSRRVARPPAALGLVAVLAICSAALPALGDPVVTTLADFEDDSVAASITEADRALLADCTTGRSAVPARGQRALVVAIGATEPGASAVCELRFRVATRFAHARRVATYVWLTQGSVAVQFRIRDADGRLFESRRREVGAHNRWVRLTAKLADGEFEPLERRAATRIVWPVQVVGYRIHTRTVGRQTVYIDDLEVEQTAEGPDLLRGEFWLDKPTHLYEPGSVVYAAVVLENISTVSTLPLTVEMSWLRADGSKLTTGRQSLSLPARGSSFRSRQPVDFSQQVPEPGLYRLVARVRAPGWLRPAVFETTVAAVYSNRALPRGRSTFFGLRTNLLREPLADRMREIAIAREIGAQLLLVETPWRRIAPQPGRLLLDDLEPVVDAVTARDIAVMLAIVEPPADLAPADFWQRQTELVAELAEHFGARVIGYQPARPPGAGPALDAAEIAGLQDVRQRLRAVRPTATLLTPPVDVHPDGPVRWPRIEPTGGLELCFATSGRSAAGLAALDRLARSSGQTWGPGQRWMHISRPIVGPGSLSDACAVLKHYVQAATAGVAGVIWADLRDDTADPRHPEQMTGLVRRDFSPKTTLLGLADTIGMLQGLIHAGPLAGTPDEFRSALFIGGSRQVAVLLPRPNRILPGVLVPYHTAEAGMLNVLDFSRRPQPLLETPFSALAISQPAPFFITLDATRSLPEPALALARPWLRVPRSVLISDRPAADGSVGSLTITLDALGPLRRSYVQLKLPPNLPVRSTFSSRALRAAAGESRSFDVKFERVNDEPLQPATATLRLSLEGRAVELPIELLPLETVRRYRRGRQLADEAFALGTLTPPPTSLVDLSAELCGGYERRKLHLLVTLPEQLEADGTLLVGLAAADSDSHLEVRISRPFDAHPELAAAGATEPGQIRGWKVRAAEASPPGHRAVHLTIPPRSLGLKAFAPGQRLLAAVRFAEPSRRDRREAVVIEWGHGLGGEDSSAGYNWLELGQ